MYGFSAHRRRHPTSIFCRFISIFTTSLYYMFINRMKFDSILLIKKQREYKKKSYSIPTCID